MSAHHQDIIDRITAILEEDNRVVAAWLEGSIARREADDYSDIDLWVCVKDRVFTEWIDEREQFAAQIGPVLSILYPYNMAQNGEMIDSFNILLEDEPSTLNIDVEVQKQSRKFFFTKDSDAEECKVLFDKEKVITYRPFNPQAVEQYAGETFDDLVVRFWHMLPNVSKTIAREDLLEAIEYYMERLADLVVMYRLLYTPEKIDWGFKDIEYDLPEAPIKDLYDLWPYPHTKSFPKLVKQLAKTFYKQSQVVGKRMRKPIDETLAKQVMSEL